MVMRLPESDRISQSREKLEGDIAVAMGGRIAEELIFGREKVTSGASQDIEMATRMARVMVTKFGMSDALGPLAYGDNEEEVFLGMSVAKTQNMSEKIAEKIDIEMRQIVDQGYARANDILSSGIDELHRLAKGLLEYETLTGDEINLLLKGEKLDREDSETEESAESAVPTSGSGSRKPKPGRGAGGLQPEPQPGS
jgi:cell division protease FtsH